ncbi:hypothetical protein ACIQUG_10380 [Ensifer sp. NPDC090286]|uniref:hypothetical protein n=1 Tax=Ensifer sp. NPDC090286 TaxID=3363991 RepID=UPI00383B333C
MKFMKVILAATTLAAAPATAQDDVRIEWELRRPFKMFGAFGAKDDYFKAGSIDRAVWDYRRDLFVDASCSAGKNPVSCSEQKLGPSRLQTMREMLAAPYKPDNNSHLRDAWLATATAWNNRERVYDSTMINGEPRVGIKARLLGPSAASLTCQWSADGIALDAWRVPCGEWLTNINIKRGATSSTLSVTVLETGKSYQLSGTDTLIRERLIVGLGDSFASGEGNPDVPVRLSEELDGDSAFPLPKRRATSTMMETDAAQWLDRDCHRSLLGAQQRAAIQFSARRPREETIFLGFACSGAEILEGIIGPYTGTGDTSQFSRAGRSQGRYDQWDGSQINQVIRALCNEPVGAAFRYKGIYLPWELRAGNYAPKLEGRFETNRLDGLVTKCPSGFKRPIDAVLLSVGGNDIGFSKIIAGVIVEGWFRSKLFSLAGQIVSPQQAKKTIADTLPGKYRELDRLLEKYLGMKDARRIIISAYPNPATDQNGALCGNNPGGMKRGLEAFPARKTATLSAGESASIVKNVIEPLNAVIGKAPDRGSRKWTVADDHLGRTIGHGICAEGNLSKEDSLETRRYLMEFNPYAEATRWFRTINDSYLIQNQMKVESEIDGSLTSLIADKYLKVYGMIHPNSMGSAANADAYLDRLEEVIPLGR